MRRTDHQRKGRKNTRLDKLKSEMACRERSVTGFLVIYEHTVVRQRYKMFYIPHLPQGWWKRIGVSNLVCWVNIGVWRSSSKEEGDWRGKMAQTESLLFSTETGEAYTIPELWGAHASSSTFSNSQGKWYWYYFSLHRVQGCDVVNTCFSKQGHVCFTNSNVFVLSSSLC